MGSKWLYARSSAFDSLNNTIGESCAICAEALSTCIFVCARGNAFMHVLETVRFTAIFVLWSIHELGNKHSRNPANEHTCMTMVIRTLSSWIDTVLYQCLHSLQPNQWRFDMSRVEALIAFRSLVLMCVPMLFSDNLVT